MKRYSAASVFLILMCGIVRAQEYRIAACSHAVCASSLDPGAKPDYLWFWSDHAAPVRLDGHEITSSLPSALSVDSPRMSVRVAGSRWSSAHPVQLIAAPARMWVEVPETMLPRFEVPKSGRVEIPFTSGTAWRARAVGESEGSWWTDVGPSKLLILTEASRRRVRLLTTDGKPVEAGVTLTAPREIGVERSVVAQLRSDRNGWVALDAIPERQPLTLVFSDDRDAPVAITASIGDIPSTITMPPAVAVQGRFVDREKRPVAGVQVEAETWLADSAIVRRTATSDAAGTWSLGQLPREARLALAAHCAGYAPLRKEISLSERLDLGTLTLRKGQNQVFRVIDDSEHKPIAGATIDARLGRKTTTNAKGLAILPDVSVDEPLDLSARGEGFLSRNATLLPPFSKETPLMLTRAFTVRGRFVDPARQPISGASVRVTSGKSFQDVRLSGDTFSLTLKPDQPAELQFLSPSTRPLRVDVEGKRGEVRDLGVLRPSEGITIRGRLLSESGIGIPNGSVWAPRPSAGGALVAWATGVVTRAESDADGVFALRGAGAEPLLLRIDAPGFARAFVPVAPEDVVSEIDLGDIRLNTGTTVRITSKPGSSGLARVALQSESGDIDTLTSTVRDGMATVAHVPSGRVVVSVINERSTTCEKEVDIPLQSEPFNVDCASGLVHIRGRVLLGQRAASGGVLIWSSPHETDSEGLIMGRVSNLGAQQQQVYGAPSQVTLRVGEAGEFESDELRSGAWRVRWVSPDSGSTAPRDVTIAEAEQSIILQYSEAMTRGEVVDQGAHPVRYATVREVGGTAVAMTGDDGKFSIAGLLPGLHRFQAQSGGLNSEITDVLIEPEHDPAPLRLVVKQEASNRFSVHVLTVGGQPAANAFVFVDALDGMTRIVTTDLAGEATVSFTDPPERLRCAMLHEGRWGLDRWRERSEWHDGLTLQIGETGSLRVSTRTVGGALMVEGPNGWNVSMLMRRIGNPMMLGSESTLNLAGLPTGVYTVRLGQCSDQANVRPRETASVAFKN